MRKPVVALAFIVVGVALVATAQDRPKPSAGPGILTPGDNLAMNDPDKFNWQLFVLINKKADLQSKVGNETTNNAVWETWADDGLTFPSTPDPKKPPAWPQNVPPDKRAGADN
jgi:hypothetical protein